MDGQYEAKTVLLATGAPVVRVPIKNLDKYEGAGVSYCTTCDGFFYRNKKVGVLGYNDFAIHEAADLLNFTQDITLFTNEMELNVSDNAKPVIEKLKVNNKKIKELGKGDILEEIVFDDGTAEDIEGLFIAFGSASSTSFALKMGIVTDGKSIIVNEKMETNIPGLYAAGDCTGVFKQVAVAVGQGAIAARRWPPISERSKKFFLTADIQFLISKRRVRTRLFTIKEGIYIKFNNLLAPKGAQKGVSKGSCTIYVATFNAAIVSISISTSYSTVTLISNATS